ncbi:hypothetical protein MTR_4g109120 [Medicago truncatula]|uniref:Uncharacterized protein n=1 Tax=Medicago truncatula TaxID=3880 RepID=A0A072USD3_MEDTR|nr:hypothetical protein MTR_4g109120 [Medicago truncatula]
MIHCGVRGWRMGYPNPSGTGTGFNFLSSLGMGRVTYKYMGIGDGDGEGNQSDETWFNHTTGVERALLTTNCHLRTHHVQNGETPPRSATWIL